MGYMKYDTSNNVSKAKQGKAKQKSQAKDGTHASTVRVSE
jgi:hypothetical protein